MSGYTLPGLYIDGIWRAGTADSGQTVANPATGEALAELSHAGPADLDAALAAAQRGFLVWRATPPDARAAIMRKAAGLLRARTPEIARLLTLENGKPIGESHWEICYAADVLDWYAEEARRIYGRVIASAAPNSRRLVLREPVGPVAGFAPWNVPVVLAGNKVAGALATGCSIVLKPAEETPAAISAYVQALHDAGLPPGVVNLVFGVPDLVSRRLIASPIVRKVSFTGSTAVGRHIAALSAPGLKRVTLELGGHAPTIVFDDADIDHAVGMLAAFKFFNAGQVCFAPTRFLVQDAVHDRFVRAMAEAADTVAVGPGLEESTRMGPLANPRRLASLAALVNEAVADGASVAAGGEPIDQPGNWWRPTVLTEVSPQSRIMREEPFGPVALTMRFSTMAEAIERANSLPYGLSAFVFTQSGTRALAMTDALECGLVGINTCLVASPDAPFGGVKDSGYGYDYASEGLDGYLHSKYVHHHGV